MRKNTFITILNSLFTLAIISYAGYFLYTTVPTDPCSEVLTFKISSIDPQFNLSETEAIRYAEVAANLWNKGLGKTILKYDANGEIEISFVYDERQKITIQNNILEESAKEQKDTLAETKRDIQIQKQNFQEVKADYDREVNQFNRDLNSYNQTVLDINSRGGAREEELQQLNQTRDNLEARKNNLQNRASSLNAYLTGLNNTVDEYNSGIDKVNEVIEKINNNSLGQFEQGVYSNRKIVLYEYDDVTTLERLIAHELGHAMGLDHTKSPDSIMYYINKGNNLVLTNDDIEEYKKVCKAKENNPAIKAKLYLNGLKQGL